MSRAPIVVLIAVVLAAAGVQTPRAAEPESTGRLVHLDVFATDARGRAIDDLKPGDFTLREEGVQQQVESVRYVREATSPEVAPASVETVEDERAAAARANARLFAIYLDEYHVTSGANTDRARAALAQFVDRALTPNDLVVVMKPLDSIFAIRLTRDRSAAHQSIESFAGRRGELEPRNAYERNFIAGMPSRIEAARNQVAWSGINALAVHMGHLADLRKTLIVVSENIGGPERHRGQEFMATGETAIRSANRSNVAIYTLDPSEPAAADADQNPLRVLSDETDGASIVGDLDAGLLRAVQDSSRYYMVTYRSARPDDGRFHEVQVQTSRNGVRLRARKGYVAPSPDEVLRARLLADANNPKPPVPLEPAPHVSPLIRPWFGVSRAPSGRSRVTFVWEPAGRVPGDRGQAKTPARLQLTAKTNDGTVLYDGAVAATGPAAIDEPGATSARAVFDMPPGRLRLRMSIEDVTSRVLDVDVRDISIREVKGDVIVGSPEVLRARNAREFRTLDTPSAVPVASREFSRTERLMIRFPAFSLSGTPPTLSARLLSRTAQKMRDLQVTPAAAGDGIYMVDLSLAGFAVGEYIVEVQAKTTAGGDAKDRVTFRVTP